MAEIRYSYRSPPMNFNPIATWLERHQPWELGDAAKSFLANSSTPSAMDSWKAATKTTTTSQQHDFNSPTFFKEPTSVLDLQSSSLSSQHSFNSVSDGSYTSTALHTVTDQLLSSDSEQDSAFLTKTTPNNILTWMELMRGSEEEIIEEDPGSGRNIISSEQHDGQSYNNSCVDMDMDFDVGTMESIATTPRSNHQSTTFEPQQPQLSELARNQIVSHNSLTLLASQESRPGYQQMNDMNKSQGGSTTTTTTLPSMFDSITALPASQLQNYTVVPTAELLRLLSSQNVHKVDAPASPASPIQDGLQGGHIGRSVGRLDNPGTNFANNKACSGEVAGDHADRWAVDSSTTATNLRLTTSRVPQSEQENGLHLVHLLLACAEAIDLCENTIAEPMLARLRSISDPEGDPMQRIALFFAQALSERLASEMAAPESPPSRSASHPDALECDIAYQAYYQILPFQKFTHFTANQALLEAVADYPCVHIVDFNICQGLQWPSFLQSLALLPQGAPQLRITAVQTDAAAARVTGNRLAEFARSLQVPFEFHVIEENLETFHRGMISTSLPDEALAVNCPDILHKLLRKEGKLHSLLCKIRSLRPVVLTVLEADANHNVSSFMSRFVQALHYYCALFDSLEATLHRSSMDRLRIESLRFGVEIRSIVALEGVDREVRHVRAEAWQSLFRQAGFQEVPMSRYAVDQAQLLLSLYETSDTMPFTLSPKFGGLSLGWQQTPVMVVSSWTC